MHVVEGFLNHSKQRDLHIFRQTADIWRQRQIHLDLGTFGKAIHQPASCRNQTRFIEQRGMQQLRHRADIPGHFIYQLDCLA